MKLSIVTVLACGILVGCGASTQEVSSNYKLPKELSDCSIYKLEGSDVNKTLHIVRCPHATTSATTVSGKYNNYVTTVTDSN